MPLRRTTAIALAAAASCLPAALAPALSEAAPGKHVPGELLVSFNPGVSEAEGGALARGLGAKVVDRVAAGASPVALVRLPPGLSVSQAGRAFEALAGVRRAEPNGVRQIALEPQDPFFVSGALWGLSHETDADIDAPGAWGLATGDPAVTVAVIDTGASIDHPDLEANIWANPVEALNGTDDDLDAVADDLHGYDFVNDDAEPDDDQGHGTHVAGTIGAVGDNGIGITGVSWDVGLMPLKAGDEEGEVALFDVLEAMEYAVAHGARVVNASYVSEALSPSERDAIAAAPNVLFVAAAGNTGDDNDSSPVYPCAYDLPNVICVAATNQVDALSTFSSGGSNFGKASVDLAAPGSGIVSTQRVANYEPPLFSDDFDAGLANWTPDPLSAWAAAGGAPFAPGQHLSDSPGGDYSPDRDLSVQLADPLDLSGEDACRARFKLAHEIAPVDRLWLEASTDATPSSWVPLGTWTGSQSVPKEELVKLLGHSREASVYLRFRLVSDSSANADGVHVDDFAVECADMPGLLYGARSGTSMAAPHVAGTAALLLDRFPSYTTAQLRSALLENTDRVPSLHCKVASGGRLNAFAALDIGVPGSPRAADCPPPPVTEQPPKQVAPKKPAGCKRLKNLRKRKKCIRKRRAAAA